MYTVYIHEDNQFYIDVNRSREFIPDGFACLVI